MDAAVFRRSSMPDSIGVSMNSMMDIYALLQEQPLLQYQRFAIASRVHSAETVTIPPLTQLIGMEAARRIRGRDSGVSVKIVAITASARASDRQAVTSAGLDDITIKPPPGRTIRLQGASSMCALLFLENGGTEARQRA